MLITGNHADERVSGAKVGKLIAACGLSIPVLAALLFAFRNFVRKDDAVTA